MAESGKQGREEQEVAEISGSSVWSASTTRMLISYYKENPILYTLFQNGCHFSILLFTCKLAIVTSFLNSKFKRIFSFKRDNKG